MIFENLGDEIMAEKRMFTKKIVDSDLFMDMPLSAQALYFHMNMNADDDGFINSPKRIQRMIGASEDDLRLLIAKGFLLEFDSGVIVVMHWLMHNTLKKDRYAPTQYQDEYAQLGIKDNKAYIDNRSMVLIATIEDHLELQPEMLGNGTALEPEESRFKTNLNEDNEKESINETIHNQTDDEWVYKQIVNMYNEICSSFPKVVVVNDSRKNAIKQCLVHYSLDSFEKVFRNVKESSFLCGDNDYRWKADFDWIMQLDKFPRVLEGCYANRRNAKLKINQNTERELDEDEVLAIHRIMCE